MDAKIAAEKKTSQAHADLVGYIFHEMRNDLNAICGACAAFNEAKEVHAFMSDVAPRTLELMHTSRLHAFHAAQVITNMVRRILLLA